MPSVFCSLSPGRIAGPLGVCLSVLFCLDLVFFICSYKWLWAPLCGTCVILQEQPAKPSFQFQLFGIFILLSWRNTFFLYRYPSTWFSFVCNSEIHVISRVIPELEPEAGKMQVGCWQGLYNETLRVSTLRRQRPAWSSQGEPASTKQNNKKECAKQNRIGNEACYVEYSRPCIQYWWMNQWMDGWMDGWEDRQMN